MDKTRDQMLRALKSLSSSQSHDGTASTPLLHDQTGRSSYTDDEDRDEDEAEEALEGVVAGAGTDSGAKGKPKGKGKYAIA
jgi:hypothetical protein